MNFGKLCLNMGRVSFWKTELLKREERDELRQVAKMLGAMIEIHYFDISFDELWRRIEIRNAVGAYGAVPITKELSRGVLA